ncbi:MAG: 1-deoxy-D-xylulose-5-phosphate synthase, partial [Clostridia bacterium]|nr:1-deoxy-D-xylulose-5-phosphate synthase [Clostridia bacterium]
LFENFGFLYYGPVDGHDMEELINTFKAAKEVTRPVLIHAVTVKGKGYGYAEKDPKNYHGVGRFDVDSGEPLSHSTSYSDIFGKCLCHLASKNKDICAITAAMTMGTGLTEFSHKFKERFFDVGIAEEHAVTFGAGLASQGMIPVFAVYSTFLQRAYDQLIHDVSLQKLHFVLGVDRAGIVGEDGETHQGVFDVSMLNSIPNTTCYSPCYFDELAGCMEQGIIRDKNLVAIRYPRGSEPYRPENFTENNINYAIYGNTDASRLIVTYGRLFADACVAKRELSKIGIEVCILKLCRIKPIDEEAIQFASKFSKVHFFEEGMLTGGIGETFGYGIDKLGFKGSYGITAVEDKFVPHASVKESMQGLRLNALGIYDIMRR